jgi:hypothetical protein
MTFGVLTQPQNTMKTIKGISVVLIAILMTIITLFILNSSKSDNHSSSLKKSNYYSLETFRTNGGGWGYNIVLGDKIVIKQDIIPGIQNSVPFYNKEDAQKVGMLVLNKLKNHSRPTIKIQEIDSLKVYYN